MFKTLNCKNDNFYEHCKISSAEEGKPFIISTTDDEIQSLNNSLNDKFENSYSLDKSNSTSLETNKNTNLLGRKKFIIKHIDKKEDNNIPQNSPINTGIWTKDEQMKFLEGIILHGNKWNLIQKLVHSRNTSQVRSHAQKFFLRLKNFKDGALGIDFASTKNCKQIIKEIQDYGKDKNISYLYNSINKKLRNKEKQKKFSSKNNKFFIYNYQHEEKEEHKNDMDKSFNEINLLEDDKNTNNIFLENSLNIDVSRNNQTNMDDKNCYFDIDKEIYTVNLIPLNCGNNFF